MQISYDIEDFRKIILGKITFKKCPCCDNNGVEYWDETGTSVLPYPHKSWGDKYESGKCENCGGLGFIEN